MPYLRQDADSTLAETLGNLSSSLSNALNPMNQIRAQDILAQVQQRRWEIQQKQALDAANANAAEVYRRANPHNLSPADLEVAVAQIRNGQYNASQTIEALKAAGGYQAAQAAARLVDAQHPDWSPAQRSSAKAQILAGKSLSEIEQSYATAANETNKATATIDATNVAATPASKEAAAIGQPETATKLDTQERLRTAPPITGPLTDPATQKAIDQRTIERGIAGVPVTADAPVSIGEAGPIATQRAEATAAGTTQAETQFKPRDLSKPQLNPPPGGFTDTTAPPAPAVTVPNPTAPFAPPVTVSRTTPAGTITGPLSTETTADTATAKARSDQLTQAMDEGATATRMKVKLAQLRDLEAIASTGGVGGQVEAAAAKRLADAGIVVGDKASAYKAMDQILNTEIPDLRKASGIQRLAGPEIQAVGKQIGSATLPPNVLNNIIANEEATADVQIARRGNAQKALGLGDQPMSFGDYTNADTELNNSLKQRADALRTQYGAIGTEAQQPAPVAQPTAPLGGSTVLDAIHGALGWLTGGSQPSQTLPAPSSSEPQYRFDPKTNSIVPVSPP